MRPAICRYVLGTGNLFVGQQRNTTRTRGLTILLLMVFSLGSLLHQTALAQPGPAPIVSNWVLGTPSGSGIGNWNVASNWSRGIVPNVNTEDSAIINGGGTAQVNTVVGSLAGSVVLGQGTAAGEAGTLEILSGGHLTVVDDPTFPADGSVRVGQNVGQGFGANLTTPNPSPGTGTLRILPGGTLVSVSLTLGGTVNSSIILGGAGSGTATVNTGAVTLGRTTRIRGPNVNFTSSGTGAAITFRDTSIFIPEITGATHSPLKTTGNAALDGTLSLSRINGFVPTPYTTYDILTASSISGQFDAIQGLDAGNGFAFATTFLPERVRLTPALIGDLNFDRRVTISDFINLASHFNGFGTWVDGDLNGDFRVTISDFVDLASNFNTSFSGETWPISAAEQAMLVGFAAANGGSTVPEPAMCGLLLPALLLTRRRRGQF
jgi:hypothetical protein